MAETLSPLDYFQTVLPKILRWKGVAATTLGVNVRFVVTGRGGGTWTVRLRPPVAVVVEGQEWKSDLTIKITATEMVNMLTGHFDPKAATAAGSIEFKGNLAILRQVAFLFQPGGNEAQVRTGTGPTRPPERY